MDRVHLHQRVGSPNQTYCGSCGQAIQDGMHHVTITTQRESRIGGDVSPYVGVLNVVFCMPCAMDRRFNPLDINQMIAALFHHDQPVITGLVKSDKITKTMSGGD